MSAGININHPFLPSETHHWSKNPDTEDPVTKDPQQPVNLSDQTGCLHILANVQKKQAKEKTKKKAKDIFLS